MDSKRTDNVCIWHETETINLIDMYREREWLWKRDHADYYDKDMRAQALKELAEQCNKSVDEVKARIYGLRNHFARETSRETVSRKKPRWKYYEQLQFLTDNLNLNYRNMTDGERILVDCKKKAKKNPKRKVTSRNKERNKSEPEPKPKNILPEEPTNAPKSITNTPPGDDAEVFGQFVASELRLINDHSQRQNVKRKIHEVLAGWQDAESTPPIPAFIVPPQYMTYGQYTCYSGPYDYKFHPGFLQSTTTPSARAETIEELADKIL